MTIVAGKIRMLTHPDVNAGDIDTALAAWRHVVAEFAPVPTAPAR